MFTSVHDRPAARASRACLGALGLVGRFLSAPLRWARFERELALRLSGRHWPD